LVAAGDKRETRGGAHGGIGVALKEAHSARGDAIDIGRREIASSVTGHIGITEIVGESKDDVRLLRRWLGERASDAGGKRNRPGGGGIRQQGSARQSRLPTHCRVLATEASLPRRMRSKSVPGVAITR